MTSCYLLVLKKTKKIVLFLFKSQLGFSLVFCLDLARARISVIFLMKKTTKIHINPTKCQNKPNKNYRATAIESSTSSRRGSNFLSPSCIDSVARDLAEGNAEDLLIVPLIAEKILQAVKNEETELPIPITELTYNIAQCIYAYRSDEHSDTQLEILSKNIKNNPHVRKLLMAMNATEQDSQYFLDKVTSGHEGSIKNVINSLETLNLITFRRDQPCSIHLFTLDCSTHWMKQITMIRE